jgi:hypothetical protein
VAISLTTNPTSTVTLPGEQPEAVAPLPETAIVAVIAAAEVVPEAAVEEAEVAVPDAEVMVEDVGVMAAPGTRPASFSNFSDSSRGPQSESPSALLHCR